MTAGIILALNALLNFALALVLARVLPADIYGALSIAVALSLAVSSASFDWVRQSALRFYSPRSRETSPQVRATLDRGFIWSILPSILITALAALLDRSGTLTWPVLTMVCVLTIGNGGIEYFTALSRALIDDKTYIRLIILRHVVMFGLAIPFLAWQNSLQVTLLALIVSVWPSILYGMRRLADARARAARPSRVEAVRFRDYGIPLVMAEALFQVISFINRAWLAGMADHAAAGYYALSFDVSFRLIAAIASVGEASLLPRLIAKHDEHGGDHARQDVSRGLVLMLLAIAPAALGFLLVARPFADLVLAAEFRQAYVALLPYAIAGAFLYAAQTFLLKPAFQLALATAPILRAASFALVVDVLALSLLPLPPLQAAASAHVIGLAAGLCVVASHAWQRRAIDISWLEGAKILAALLIMAPAVVWLGGLHPSWFGLGMAVLGGASLFGLVAYGLDIAGLRTFLKRRSRSA
jgi:O-antigen/teichoic acid export membrane protein